MKSIVINVGLLPIMLAALPLIVVLSLIPRSRRAKTLRSRILDWFDQVTNDYGAELIYLSDPASANNDQASLQHSAMKPSPPLRAGCTLTVVPAPERLALDETIRRQGPAGPQFVSLSRVDSTVSKI